MKRLLIVLVASLVLGLVGGVSPAWAGVPEPPPTGTPLQSATQSNSGTNDADQTAVSVPIVESGDNIALGNGGADGKSSCNPCGGNGGTVEQDSGNDVDSSASNNANQTNDQSNGAGQSQTAGQDESKCCSESSGGAEQSAQQSNNGTNDADQTAVSVPIVVSGPNIALFNEGNVDQNSGNDVDSSASNHASQTNDQSNDADQSQTGGKGGGSCCSNNSGSGTQTADQSNKAKNDADQTAVSVPIVVSGPNIAVGNKGDVHQNSGNDVDSSAKNDATQTNDQSNDADQSQTGGKGGGSCCSKNSGSGTQTADQSNWAKNDADQTAVSVPIVVSGPNIAAFNHGDVRQNSGNDVDSSAKNSLTQSNDQSNDLDQRQSVEGGKCCPKKDDHGYSGKEDGKGCCAKDGGGATQTADQSNWAKNDADQTAVSVPIVESGDNIAFGNGFGHDKCFSKCDGGGSVHQNSGNDVDSSAKNSLWQSNTQSNDLDQRQSVEGGGKGDGATQTADQSNWAKNDADQTAVSVPIVESGDNIAAFNGGPVRQNSGNDVDSSAKNSLTQSNDQSNDLDQRQSVEGGKCCPKKDDHGYSGKEDGKGCCAKDGGGATQTADQSNWAKNDADQTAVSVPIVESGDNIAFGNGFGHDKCFSKCDGGGSVHQNSGNDVDSSAKNSLWQSNTQSNDLDQRQSVEGGGKGDGATQTADQSNWAKNDADQTAVSVPIVESGDNIAAFNGGPVRQNSGNDVDSSAKNSLTQSNDQSNDLDQRQSVEGGKADCTPKCEPKDCEPKQCEPKRCKPKECNGKEYKSKEYKSKD
jgi:hypothetical protein